MKDENLITVVSSHSDDTIIDSSGIVREVVPGGPAFYITNALQKRNVRHKLYANQKIGVEVLSKDGMEIGRVPETPYSEEIGTLELSDWVIVSTVLNEWNFNGMEKLPPYTFVDLQGFVRDGHNFGQKHVWEEPAALLGKVYCIKGTKEETKYLPKSVIEEQKNRLLIITDAENDIEVFSEGKRQSIPVVKAGSLRSTIGAGDTFLANLVVLLQENRDISEAVHEAARSTSEFLSQNYNLNDK